MSKARNTLAAAGLSALALAGAETANAESGIDIPTQKTVCLKIQKEQVQQFDEFAKKNGLESLYMVCGSRPLTGEEVAEIVDRKEKRTLEKKFRKTIEKFINSALNRMQKDKDNYTFLDIIQIQQTRLKIRSGDRLNSDKIRKWIDNLREKIPSFDERLGDLVPQEWEVGEGKY